MYIINKDISFTEEDGHLENQVTGESLVMACSTRRLFSVLIAAQGNPVERDVLCKTVWDDHGLRSSYSNLNQYVSILRKQLAQAGCPDDAIITIPKVGFMFNPKVEVRKEIKYIKTNFPVKKPSGWRFIINNLYYFAFTLCVFIILIIFSFVFHNQQESALLTLNKVPGYPPECNIYALPGGQDIKKMISVSLFEGNCEKDFNYFTFRYASNPNNTLVISCKKSKPEYFSSCHNRRDFSE